MQIEIHSRPFELTQALHSHILRQLKAALRRGASHIQRIKVQLSDINGPKGGKDKHCQISVDLGSRGSVFIAETQDDLYHAIVPAARRLSRTIARRTDKANPSKQKHQGKRNTEFDLDHPTTDEQHQ